MRYVDKMAVLIEKWNDTTNSFAVCIFLHVEKTVQMVKEEGFYTFLSLNGSALLFFAEIDVVFLLGNCVLFDLIR